MIAVDRRLSDRCQCRLARQCPAHAPTRSRAQVHVRATVAGWGWGDGGTARTEDEDLRIRLTERAIETIRRRGSAAERCDSSSRNPPAACAEGNRQERIHTGVRHPRGVRSDVRACVSASAARAAESPRAAAHDRRHAPAIGTTAFCSSAPAGEGEREDTCKN